MERIIQEIKEERLFQDGKWGVQNHKPIEWMAILMEEVGEASKEVLEAHFTGYYTDGEGVDLRLRYRKELIQVAAVAIAMIECLDRNELNNPQGGGE